MGAAWIEVFKTGTHTSGNGITRTYTKEDLESIARTYNEQSAHEAPLVIGHPKTDDPAYGWAKKFKVAGEKLLAYVDQVTDGIVEAVQNGHYKKVSLAIYANGLVKHIGLLGAAPPAVKGLAPVQFSMDLAFEEYVWVTDETRMPLVGRILAGIREFLIEKFGVDIADKFLDRDDIELLKRPADENMIAVPPAEAPGAQFSEINAQEEQKMDEVKAKIKALEDALAAQNTQIGSVAAQFSEVQAGITSLKDLVATQFKLAAEQARETQFNAAKTSFTEFCETLVRDRKVLPAEKELLIDEYTDLLRAEETLTFAEGVMRPSERMKKRLGDRPQVFSKQSAMFADPNRVKKSAAGQQGAAGEMPVQFAALADRVDETSIELHTQIQEYAEKHNVSYEQAADIVTAS